MILARFETREQKIVCKIVKEISERNLGGRDLDWALLEWLDAKIKQEHDGKSILQPFKLSHKAII